MKDALPEYTEHLDALNQLEDGLRVDYTDVLQKWKEQVEGWEADPSMPNPYERRAESESQKQDRLFPF